MDHPQVILFTQAGCADSRRVRDWLRARNVPFVERNVIDDPEAMAELAAQQIFATPLLVIGQQTVFGFRPEAIETALRSIHYGNPRKN